MIKRETLYLLACSAAPVLAVAGLFGFAASNFVLSWQCALGVVLCMELRAQVGQRIPHTSTFWLHIFAALSFFLALTALAFFAPYGWLVLLTAITGAVALYTGAILWHEGLKVQMLHLR